MLQVLTYHRIILKLCRRCSSQFARQRKGVGRENTFQDDQAKHRFKLLYPWKTTNEFAELLKKNILYNEGGLIAINKPYGVCSRESDLGGKKRAHTTLPDSPHTLEDALEPLAKLLGVQWLKTVKCTEKYSSGVSLLVSDEATEAKVKKAVKRAKPFDLPYMVYWVITVGYPNPPFVREKVGIKLVDIGENGEKEPEIDWDISRAKIKRQAVKPVIVEYRTLEINKQLSVALLEVAVSAMTYHFIRVYAARKAAGIMGDPLYASRVRHILGKAISIGPHHSHGYDPQPLPDGVCRALQLPVGCTTNEQLPLMLHLHKLILKGYHKKEDLVIIAPPSPLFQWTCQNFGWMPSSDPELRTPF